MRSFSRHFLSARQREKGELAVSAVVARFALITGARTTGEVALSRANNIAREEKFQRRLGAASEALLASKFLITAARRDRSRARGPGTTDSTVE